MQPLVLFDLDNTLVDRRLTLARWAATFRAHCGLGLEDEGWVIEQLSERASPAHFEGIRTRFGLAESAETLWEGYCADIAAAVVCPAEALVGLERLRALGWRIGIVTNGAAGVQWAKLRSTGIADRVDAVCISEEVGARKPEPAVFLEAIWRCGGHDKGGEAWMVGDNPVKDIEGGRTAGLRTIWISGDVTWPQGLPEPDHHAPDVRVAIELLAAGEPERKQA
ncbi:Pyrimidine 5'-nucleotidase YjjG [Streptomyces sp. ADI96-02]|uniref:HAD family hydrolase n=1 Tax=Streptomyces sp. ADI96-02 TaxID=1522760 RepID=UPI000F55666F|nr:HAD-IA family hydrolase [Streptomyces sp. ADI96-02]RPK63504.1 Pyrimidine 5'-nucleotidase YjjG [Streptomyces sp. ADI96-02]